MSLLFPKCPPIFTSHETFVSNFFQPRQNTGHTVNSSALRKGGQLMSECLGKLERKDENAVNQQFLLFPMCFQSHERKELMF